MGCLEIKHLRMIRAIAETENITKAARRLFISQSGLSQQLKDIEGKLGADLFFRTRKKMVPTPMGKQLIKTAAGVLVTVDDAELEIARAVSGEKGELKVGTQCIFCYKWLPHVMKQFQAKFPGVDFEIGNSVNPAEDLASKRFDIVITGARGDDEHCTYTPLFEDQLVCIMPSGHPLSAMDFVRLQDFSRYKLISHAERELNKFYQFILKPKGIEPQRLMPVGAPHAIVSMVAAGFGISVFPAWAVRTTLASNGICARPITRRGLPLTWNAVFLPGANMPVFQNEFIQIVGNLNAADIAAIPDGCPGTA